ncbi:MAG: DUF1778 domain-containing protein [Gemmatimonadales bacterium]|nr:MAG: DUF1778 domain-containing protein [Gemmatimonadales bacterium]
MATNTKTADDRLDFRLSSEHKRLIEKAAAYSGESLTGFAVSSLLERARGVIEAHESVLLSSRDRDLFLGLLADPPEPTDALQDASRRYDELIGPGD